MKNMELLKPAKLLQLYRFIKFPLTQTIGQNITMMQAMTQDLLAVSEDHQFKLMDQAEFLSWKQYGTTFLCKDHDVVEKDLASTCIGAYYLQNLTSIQLQSNSTKILQGNKYTFKLGTDKWFISTPESYTSTLQCPSNFKTISAAQTTTAIAVPSGCSLDLHSIFIDPDTNSVDNKFETNHYDWFWDLDVLFPRYITDQFGNILRSYRNKTLVSIDFINQAVKLEWKMTTTNEPHSEHIIKT